jgi:hypothetical protein
MKTLTKHEMLAAIEKIQRTIEASDDKQTYHCEVSRQAIERPGGDGRGWVQYDPSPFVTITIRMLSPLSVPR